MLDCSSRTRMNVHRIQFECTAWRKERAIMRGKWLKEAVYWPTTVKNLLEERKITSTVMEFLAATRAGDMLSA